MQIIKPTNENIKIASQNILNGGLVAFPTETVYGLGARADITDAVNKIYSIKERPRFNPLIIHVSSINEAKKLITFNKNTEKLSEKFWPGPLTLVGRKKKNNLVCDLCCANLKTLAVRISPNVILQKLLSFTGVPIAAPSANKFGKISTTKASDVLKEFGNKIDLIIDGGHTNVGLESTIVDVSQKTPIVLRKGGIPINLIAKYLGNIKIAKKEYDINSIKAPGMLKKHYSPNTPLRLCAKNPKPGEAWLDFGPLPRNIKYPALTLSKNKNITEAAYNLYSMLRLLDETGSKAIAVKTIPKNGLGETINDRLERAANKSGFNLK